MDFDEKLLQKIKDKIEFDKTKSELLIEFINKMGKVGDDLKLHINKIMKNSYLVKKGIENSFKIHEIAQNYKKNLKSNEVIAVDGSSNIGGQISGKYVCLISVARIHLFLNDNNLLPSEYYWGDLKIIDAIDENDVKKSLEIEMIKKETETYEDSIQLFNQSSNDYKILFIDGPVIDPPTYKDEEYIKYRCEVIKKLIKNKIILIGCVKRIFSNEFIHYVKDKIKNDKLREKIDLYPNDSYLISSLIADHRKQNEFHGIIISDFYNYNNSHDSTLECYKLNGIDIKSLFFQYSTKHNLIRVDIPFVENLRINFDEIYEIVKTNLIEWSYPGIDIPYPVYLSHEFSKIRNGCARKIYEDIITKNFSNKPIGQLLINMLK
ncbi:MAG: DNA double-strand break repair nuclease NurA [Promethearchaeota archaeon]